MNPPTVRIGALRHTNPHRNRAREAEKSRRAWMDVVERQGEMNDMREFAYHERATSWQRFWRALGGY